MADDFGFLLVLYRERLGISGYALARDTGTMPGTVTRVEKGLRSPPDDSVRKWVKALKLNAEELTQFMRAAQRSRAYSQKHARPELDALNAELEAAKAAFRGLAPLLNVTDAIREEFLALFEQPNTMASFMAVKETLRKGAK